MPQAHHGENPARCGREGLLQAMEHFGQEAPSFGRLANRIQMAALSFDVAMLGQGDSDSTPPLEEHWDSQLKTA